MTRAYHDARQIIKRHVNASKDDVLLTVGTSMTGAINKFLSHMEHHSNQTSWLETIAEVAVIPSGDDGLPSLISLEHLLEKHSERSIKIAAITGCSNVTGIQTNYHDIARLMHQNNGLCFVDFAF